MFAKKKNPVSNSSTKLFAYHYTNCHRFDLTWSLSDQVFKCRSKYISCNRYSMVEVQIIIIFCGVDELGGRHLKCEFACHVHK